MLDIPADRPVLVVGAGPAGATAARTLAAAGVPVRLVDRAAFPRNKPCGGGISVRALRRFPYLERELSRIPTHAVHAATKRLLSGSIMNQQTLGATRNDPFEAFEDILARKDPRGYVKATIAFNENLFAPASVDVDVAYQKLIAQSGEDKVLEAARTLAAGKPHFLYNRELDALQQLIERR